VDPLNAEFLNMGPATQYDAAEYKQLLQSKEICSNYSRTIKVWYEWNEDNKPLHDTIDSIQVDLVVYSYIEVGNIIFFQVRVCLGWG